MDKLTKKADARNRQLSETEATLDAVSARAEGLDQRVKQTEGKLEIQRELNAQIVHRVSRRHPLDRGLFIALKRFPRGPDIPIQFKEGDGEAFWFANFIATALNEPGGWDAGLIPQPHKEKGFPVVGVHVYAKTVLPTWKEAEAEINSDSSTRPAYALAKAIGWECNVLQDTSLDENEFRIYVGERKR